MAKDYPSWGYTRIVGALTNVGHTVARTTVAKILKAAGIAPAPERPTTWRTFLMAHAGTIAAADFFSVEVWTARGLVTHYVLFAIDLATRAVHIAGVTKNPDGAFMAQVARTSPTRSMASCAAKRSSSSTATRSSPRCSARRWMAPASKPS